MKILVTSGGMQEPIDGVRSITNKSSGKTGAIIVDHFIANGAEVVLLKNRSAVAPESNCEVHQYTSFDDLDSLLKRTLKDNQFDAVIHLAAISDYKVKSILIDGKAIDSKELEKIDSSGEISINLMQTEKLIDKIKAYHNEKTILVGFKLTNSLDLNKRQDAIDKIFNRSSIDFLVHNDLNEINATTHKASVVSRSETIRKSETKEDIAKALFEVLTAELTK